MIGKMISKIREEKGMTKTELSKLTGINIGHLTHIEKEERTPSQKALKNICKALEVPYQQLMYTYGKTVSEDQLSYGFINHVSYNKVPLIKNIVQFIDCPSNFPSASLSLIMQDSSMEPLINSNSTIFIELNSLLNNNDIGIFSLNNSILIRKFSNRKEKITLKALNPSFENIIVEQSDSFYIIGKILF